MFGIIKVIVGNIVGEEETFLRSEKVAYDYFYKLKWPSGFACPKCGFKGAYIISTRKRPLYQCQSCDHQTTLTAGTVMERSRTSLHKWMVVTELLSQSNSVNAVQLSDIVNVTYKTAFAMLKKIRMALTDIDREVTLSGTIHASYSYPKTKYYAYPVCQDANDIPVMIGGSFDLNGNLSYLKMKPGLRHIGHTSVGVKDFQSKHVAAQCRSFRFLEGIRLYSVPPLSTLLGQVFRWIGKTFRGVSKKYLEHYLDEFCFRINRSMQPLRTQSDISHCIMNTKARKNMLSRVAA